MAAVPSETSRVSNRASAPLTASTEAGLATWVAVGKTGPSVKAVMSRKNSTGTLSGESKSSPPLRF